MIWLDEIVEKLEVKHQVSKSEVNDIFQTEPYFRFVEKGHRSNENVYAAMGKSDAGRYLIVFFVYKKNQYALILSARDMAKSKSSLSKGSSYKEIGDFWDTHDLADFWDETTAVEFEVDIDTEVNYYALDKMLSNQLQSMAQKRGISADTLLNMWVQEKLQQS